MPDWKKPERNPRSGPPQSQYGFADLLLVVFGSMIIIAGTLWRKPAANDAVYLWRLGLAVIGLIGLVVAIALKLSRRRGA